MHVPAPLFSTAYLPPIAFFSQIARYDHIEIEQYETFKKQTYRNRTIILTANGPLSLSVPIVHTNGNHTMTCDIGISYREHWNIKHWRAIESAYSASPFFLFYKDDIAQIISTKYDRLIDLNDHLLNCCLRKLRLNISIDYSADYVSQPAATDFRNQFSPKRPSSEFQFPAYNQVFESKYPFQPNLSILDLLFNLGPDAKAYLLNCTPRPL